MIENNSVFIIAEAGSNWRMGNVKRDMKMAKTLIDVASNSNADAVWDDDSGDDWDFDDDDHHHPKGSLRSSPSSLT